MKKYIYNPIKEPVPTFIKQFKKQLNLSTNFSQFGTRKR